MPTYNLSVANVSWCREGDAAHFMCTTPGCGNKETVPDFEHSERPKQFLMLAGFSGFEAKCCRCGKGGEMKIDPIHR